MPPVDEVELLLERDGERAELQRLLDRALTGAGGVVVLEGPAGIGKTRLIDAARGWALERGFLVARAAGAILEQEFPFGAVRQLFEPLVAAADDPDGLLAGAAAVAAPLCGRHAPVTGTADLAPGVVLHGLYWVTAGLADRAPLALVCDDAHWFDAPSLRFLAYLAHRIAELPVVCIVAARPHEPRPESELLTRLQATPNVTAVCPAPLSAAAVVSSSLDQRPPQAFCDAIAEVSGGNPFLVREALRATRSAGIQLDELRLRRLAEVRTDATVLTRLGQLPPDALDVARAAAILGADAHLRHVAALTGLDIDVAGVAADALLRADILGPHRPLAFIIRWLHRRSPRTCSPGSAPRCTGGRPRGSGPRTRRPSGSPATSWRPNLPVTRGSSTPSKPLLDRRWSRAPPM
ncbi:MAG: AAA family ATPase [Ilumatobacteraceae bacterium]